MNILFVSSEVSPFSKTGGLADVTSALPKALKEMGHNVSIITPKYQIAKKAGLAMKIIARDIEIPISNRYEKTTLYKAYFDKNIPVYLIRNDKYYDRPYLYGSSKGDYLDNAERFIYFSRAVLEVCDRLDNKPDIIHCNDWQTGLIPVYLKTIYKNDYILCNTKSVFTIHNLGYQGQFWHFDMHLTNLDWDVFTPEGIEYFGKINMLKAGIIFSDVVTTVSKTYSKEIQTKEHGQGLDKVLQYRTNKLFGITNGVDYSDWNPETDTYIKKNYNAKDIAGKDDCKKELFKVFGLKPCKKPIIAMISRLADQKGFDLLLDAIDQIIELGAVLVILGTGDKFYHNMLEELKEKYKKNMGLILLFDNALAHKIEAGADMFLMPSRYEPCGLNQMYSLKYGTIPIVRSVGGLNDTVKNYSPKTGKGNGFKFKKYDAKNMISAIKKAVQLYKNKQKWKALIQNAMSEDHSWKKSAKEYIKLYKRAVDGFISG